MVAKPLLFLGLALLSCTSASESASTDRFERMVAASNGEPMCSITLKRSGPGDQWKDEDLSRLFDLVDQVRATDPALAATYIDFQSLHAVTITSLRACDPDVQQWHARARQAGILAGLQASDPFSPQPMRIENGRVNPTLTEALHQLAGPGAKLEECSLAINMEPTPGADVDRAVQALLAKARDVYAIPILFSAFSAQEDASLYVTFYRDCDRKKRLFDALRLVLARGGEGERLKSFSEVSSEALKNAYGVVF